MSGPVMHPDYLGYYPDPPIEYPGVQQDGEERHRAPADAFRYPPLIPPDSAWDPAEELAFMLRDAVEQQPRVPAAHDEDPPAAPDGDSHRDALVEITAELPPMQAAHRGHRKVRTRRHTNMIRVASYSSAAMVTVIASAVSIFGGLISYDPLRFIAASRAHTGAVSWWPLLVFGPWLVASLSILRASLHQRRAFHSWSVLLIFSAIAMTLCVAQAPRNMIDTAAAALPSFASLACFQQVVRQITLTRPPRRSLPRHRMQAAEPAVGGARHGVPSAGGPPDRARAV